MKGKNVKIYDPTPDLKTCCHILFDMLSLYFCSDCIYMRYLRYIDLYH